MNLENFQNNFDKLCLQDFWGGRCRAVKHAVKEDTFPL